MASVAGGIDCNRTEVLDRSRLSAVIHSPGYPMPYPESVFCTTYLSAPAGYSVVINFDLFDLEDEEE